jgi:hypothetical protein
MQHQTSYRGYDLETKHLLVGWQVTVTKDGCHVIHLGVSNNEGMGGLEAEAYIDAILAQASHGDGGTPPLGELPARGPCDVDHRNPDRFYARTPSLDGILKESPDDL